MKRDILQIIGLLVLCAICFFQGSMLLIDRPPGVAPYAVMTVLIFLGLLCGIVAYQEIKKLLAMHHGRSH